MGWMDMLKSLKSQMPQTINQDGKQYQFTPGAGGSLIVPGKKQPPLKALQAPPNVTPAKNIGIGSTRG